MTYTAKTAKQLRNEKGSLLQKVASENALIDTEIDSIQTGAALSQRKFVNLTALTGTNTGLATTGVDLATGSDISIYGHFFPKAVTLIGMHDYLTEAYVKDTDDAKIEVYNDAVAPVKLFGRTLTAEGEAAKAKHTTAPEAGKASVAAGTGIVLTAVNTAANTGTGHAIVVLEYVEAP